MAGGWRKVEVYVGRFHDFTAYGGDCGTVVVGTAPVVGAQVGVCCDSGLCGYGAVCGLLSAARVVRVAVLQGMLLFDVCLLMLPFEGVNEPRCRRAARLASLPARPLGEARLPWAMSAEAMALAMNSRLTDPEPIGEGGVVADYLDHSGAREVALYPQSEGCWVLLLWSARGVELRDSEVAAICRQHQLTVSPDFTACGVDALCLWRNGTLYIYPAAAQDDVEPVLRALNPVA